MADEGPSPSKLIIEACRRDNLELLEEVISDLASKADEGKGTEDVAKILNETRDGLGSGALHVAVDAGSYDVIDLLLDQEGLEIDEKDRNGRETPLQKALKNAFKYKSPDNTEEKMKRKLYIAITAMLLDAGCDTRIQDSSKNNALQSAVENEDEEVAQILREAEYKLQAGNDLIVEDDNDGPIGSASDSD